MLMAIYTCLRRIRPNHMNSAFTRSLCQSELQRLEQLQKSIIYGQHVYKFGARHYVQAPEARQVPDEKTVSGLQQPHQQQQQQQREQQQQQQNLQYYLSPENIKESSSDRGNQKQDNQSNNGRDSPPLKMSRGVEIPYDISWIFPRLRNPSILWYITSQIVITLVGLFSKVILVLLNNTKVYNKDRLVKAVVKRPTGTPLVTVSNHYSCFDDPGLWGILPVQYVCNSCRIRWSMAAHDICFTKAIHAMFFLYGKCIPVVRGMGVYQEAINLCIEKCAAGHWVHVFPEGKVNMEKEQMRLKWGVGRIIYESPKIPIILPMWHEGMDTVLPNVEPYMLQMRKKVTVNVGQPLDLNDFVQNLKNQQVPEPVARKLITDKIQEALLELRFETEKLHVDRIQRP